MNKSLSYLGIETDRVHWNLSPAELYELSLNKRDAHLIDLGALVVDTGKFTGRSPKDRFIVKDGLTAESVDWGNINIPISEQRFEKLLNKVANYLADRELFVRDAYACSKGNYRLNIRVVNELPWQNLFASNMFIRPKAADLEKFTPDWHVLAAPGFEANPKIDGTRGENFAIISFRRKKIIIGGTAYTGEIKKGIFSVLNFLLPTNRNVLSMHCSANVGKHGDTAVFFGLSGTGKTTLSTDPDRKLIGDDEHGWDSEHVFNFEGGCYAKCIDLKREKEPQIYDAIKFGAMVENIELFPGTRTVDFANGTKTPNTRVSYPIEHIDNIVPEQMGPAPRNIFFLTADAFGILPPISKLTEGQAMYHFISGYTAKVAGTEADINDPEATFSACFGAPFLPLHPTVYAEMLGKKMKETEVNVWLINTGWTGGAFGVGKRIKLHYTRAMISAALCGDLDSVEFKKDDIFGLAIPESCSGVPSELLIPRKTWNNGAEYDEKARDLAQLFIDNFKQFEAKASPEILSAGPKVSVAQL